MRIGVVTLELHLASAGSLKDKRRLIKSLLGRLRGRFNVSAAEVAAQDSWRTAVLAVTCVANDTAYLDEVLAAVARYVEADRGVELVRYETEIL